MSDDPEAVRAACNAELAAMDRAMPSDCMYPWCVCNRLPDLKAEGIAASSPAEGRTPSPSGVPNT